MKTSALLNVSCIVAFSTFSEIFCLPRSLELSRRWLYTRSVDLSGSWPSKRSSSPGVPLCLLGRRSAAQARSTPSEEKDDEDDGHSCSRSINLVETVDSSDYSRKGAHKTGSTSAHSSRRKASTSESSHSFAQRYWKPTKSNNGHKNSGYHSKKYKSHYFHQKLHPAANYASVKKTGSKKDSTGSTEKHTASKFKYKGSPVKHTGSHVMGHASSMTKNETSMNTTENKATDTGSLANNSVNALNDIENAVDTANNTRSAVSNPDSTVHNPGSEVQYMNLDGPNGMYQGKATFFYQEGNPGACGKVHDDSAFIVAIQSKMYDDGKHCGKTVMITRKSTGKTIKAIAADECPGCPTGQSLDLSVGAFNALGNPAEGIFDIHWAIVD